MTQTDRVLMYMRDFGSISQVEAMRDLGCMRLAARISDLKRKRLRDSAGHGIEFEPVWRRSPLCDVQIGGDTIMRDKQTAPFITDINGVEIYDGNEYFVSDEGNIAAALPGENWNVHNALIEYLVETFGTNYIAEMCGLAKRVCKI